MKINHRIGVFIAALFVCTVGFANLLSGSSSSTTQQKPSVTRDYYIQADIAYMSSQWSSFVKDVSNDDNVFAYGGEMGVSLVPHFYLAGGGFYLPKVNYSNDGGGNLTSWLLYGGARVSAPIIPSIQVFATAGVGYRIVNDSSHGVGNRNYWTPIFEVGGLYELFQNLDLGFEYFRVPVKDGASGVPAGNLYTALLSYQFNA